MKIRIGFALGVQSATNDAERFGAFVEDLERLGFDSLWLSERIGGDTLDPLVGMTYAAARTKKLKFGMSVMVLPGRNPVVLAKELASLDRLSGGRLLPAFGLGAVDRHEQSSFGVKREERAKIFNESLPLLRRLWAEDDVDHDGTYFTLKDVTVRPKPIQQPMDVWMGGIAPSEVRRVGRMSDGWLPSFCTADDIRAGIPVITEEADKHDRALDPEHFGALIAYRDGPLPDLIVERLRRRRPEVDPADLIPDGLDGVTKAIDQMLDAGASKFVVLPLLEPADWTTELERVAAALLPLQN
jgi:probable F420-dependent oxidoreductase